jgi:hypothetical protein
MLRSLVHAVSVILLVGVSHQVRAQDDTTAMLFDALRMDILEEVIITEGQGHIRETAETYLDQRRVDGFVQQTQYIYDPQSIRDRIYAGMRDGLTEDQRAVALAFYQSDLGTLVAELEATARQAISADEVEEAAYSIAQSASEQDDPRIATIERAIEDLELVEMNMSGAMNAQYSFLMRLTKVDRLGLSQGEILSMLDEAAEDTMGSIAEWLVAFMYMAYAPLDDEQLDQYVSYQLSENGDAVNKALFKLFNEIERDSSAALGKELAEALQSQEL